MMVFKTHRAVVRWINAQIKLEGGLNEFAHLYQVNPRTVYEILRGEKSKTITAKIAKKLGMTLAYGRKKW